MSRERRRDASTPAAAKRRSYVAPSYESEYWPLRRRGQAHAASVASHQHPLGLGGAGHANKHANDTGRHGEARCPRRHLSPGSIDHC